MEFIQLFSLLLILWFVHWVWTWPHGYGDLPKRECPIRSWFRFCGKAQKKTGCVAPCGDRKDSCGCRH